METDVGPPRADEETSKQAGDLPLCVEAAWQRPARAPFGRGGARTRPCPKRDRSPLGFQKGFSIFELLQKKIRAICSFNGGRRRTGRFVAFPLLIWLVRKLSVVWSRILYAFEFFDFNIVMVWYEFKFSICAHWNLTQLPVCAC